MSQPVKLSDALVLDARIAGEAQERSIARQVEFWAKLGRRVELLLDGERVLSLCRAGGTLSLSDLVEKVDTPQGREMFARYLASEPYPHYEPHPAREGLLVRTEEDGVRTVGRFVNRVFVADRSAARKRALADKPNTATSKPAQSAVSSRDRRESSKSNPSRSSR